MNGKMTWVLFLVLASGLALGGCAQDPGTGQDIILNQAGGGGYADCYTPCHRSFPSAGYGPWDVSGWYSRAGTPLSDSPYWTALNPAQQAAAIFSTVEHPGWGLTPESFDPGLTTWNVDAGEILDGPYYFRARGTIEATHFGALWVTNEPNKVALFVPPKGGTGDSFFNGFLGYLERDMRAPAKGGIVDSSTPNACTASCHGTHPTSTNEVNRQWAEGAHHPRLKGPVTYYLSNYPSTYDSPSNGEFAEDTVTAPGDWHAVDHNDFSCFTDASRSYCINCHSGPGLADQAPAGMNTMTFFKPDTVYRLGGGFITCNGCHDGQGYPTADEPRLRFADKIWLFGQMRQSPSRQSAYSSLDGLGNSAMCVYCHQGRSGCRILVDYDISVNRRGVRNRHDGVASVWLYPGNGMAYELTATETYGRNEAHAGIGCVGCHMAPGPSGKETIGGHSFMTADEAGSENIGACSKAGCHPGAVTMEEITNHTADWDSNQATITAKSESDWLFSVLEDTLCTFPTGSTSTAWLRVSAPGENISINAWPSSGWSTTQARAARIASLNHNCYGRGRGAWAHNAKYSVQLMRDSINLLRANFDTPLAPLGGVRP